MVRVSDPCASAAYDVIKRVGPIALHRYAGNYVHWPHSHACAEICFVLAGVLREHVGDKVEEGGPGSILLKPAQVVHANRTGPSAVLLLCARPAGALARHVTDLAIGSWRCLKGDQAALLTFRLATEVIDQDRFGAIDEALLTLVADTGRPDRARKHRASPPWLRRVRDRLHASLDQRPSVVELAESEGLHPVYLTRRFRETYGASVSAYLRRLKIFEGARRLLEGPDTLTTIAHDLGFADQSHFCRCFHAAMHLTPMQYRRLLNPSYTDRLETFYPDRRTAFNLRWTARSQNHQD
jgi:AraC family transcriptional regulator